MSSLISRSTAPPLIATRHQRAAIRRVDQTHAEAMILRAQDMARRELAKGRASDITDLAHHAMHEFLALEQDLKATQDASPFDSDLLRGIAEDAGIGIRHIVRRFSQEG
jgi:hypothetical protein